jgi:hypothetical protein
MPEKLYVHYVGPTGASVYPQGAFSPFDPFDIYEQTQYPRYVDPNESQQLADAFNVSFTDMMKKNNVILTSDPADYTLQITMMDVTESLYRSSYVDSCSWWNEMSYVYYSSINATIHAKLTKNGVYVDSWERHAGASEDIRNKTDGCNKPLVRSISRQPSSLFYQMGKELRKKVSNKLYQVEFK